jgi:thymidylate synthase
MWFPEDIVAANQGERVPCSFGWHFMERGDELHCSYHMRSCDVVRHLHNDLYFANRLGLWLIQEAGLNCKMGYLHFSSTSLHCFNNDRYTLGRLIGVK